LVFRNNTGCTSLLRKSYAITKQCLLQFFSIKVRHLPYSKDMGIRFYNSKANHISKRFILNCAYCKKVFYSGDIVNHTIKCSELPRTGEVEQNQQLTDILLHFLGFKNHLEIDFQDPETVEFISGLYSFFFTLRQTKNIKSAFSCIEGDRYTRLLLYSLAEELRSYNIPIYTNIIQNYIHPNSQGLRYYYKNLDYKVDSAYKSGRYNWKFFCQIRPTFNSTNILTYQDGAFGNH
jgi:hypothetical protein